MAMPPTEVRYKKNAVYPMLALLIFMFVVLTFTMFFNPVIHVNWRMILSYIVSLGFLVLAGSIIYKRFTNPDPVMTFHSSELVLHRKRKTIRWASITEWRIRQDKSGHTLVIRTKDGRVQQQLSMLDHSARSIKELMASYIREPGPHGVMR